MDSIDWSLTLELEYLPSHSPGTDSSYSHELLKAWPHIFYYSPDDWRRNAASAKNIIEFEKCEQAISLFVKIIDIGQNVILNENFELLERYFLIEVLIDFLKVIFNLFLGFV